MTTNLEKAHELANTTPFKERARQYFLLSIDHTKAIFLKERDEFEDAGKMDELDVLWISFNSEEVDRIQEIEDSLYGMMRFVEDGIGADPKKPISPNKHSLDESSN